MKMGESLKPSTRIGDRAFDALAIGLVLAAYVVVFAVVRSDVSFGQVFVSALLNALPLVLLTAAVRPAIRRWLIGSGVIRQVLGHVALAALFSALWHWMILILVGIRDDGSATEFTVSAFFSDPALAWQLLQGVTIYTLVATLTYMREQGELPAFLGADDDLWPDASAQAETEPPMKRYFIRRGEDIQPIDIPQIISIIGADDYAEVTSAEGSHLVRTTLAKFESALDPEQFLRVHRSRIVNINKIDRAQPIGDGRMVLHMESGEDIQTSRSGAKSLRNRVI
ncbi:MAG: LytTR family DNA-binding domain-containing protein [Erythrobacter sp.]|uniref:LytTR family DNA-binding domain-containing protein n=1 Tax=Erythrobacter sp. TaxID=1042 RepID=UPI003296E5E0